jgi:hypothetical protein
LRSISAGPFTDLIGFDDRAGRLIQVKSLTTAADLVQGIIDCIDKSDVDAAAIDELIYGLDHRHQHADRAQGATTGLVVTRGTRDVYIIGRGNRPESYICSSTGIGPASKIAFGLSHGIFPIIGTIVAGVQNIKPILLTSARRKPLSDLPLGDLSHMIPSVFAGMRLGIDRRTARRATGRTLRLHRRHRLFHHPLHAELRPDQGARLDLAAGRPGDRAQRDRPPRRSAFRPVASRIAIPRRACEQDRLDVPATMVTMMGKMPWLTPKAIFEAGPMPKYRMNRGRMVICGVP